MAGHSYGEYTALYAAGVISLESLFKLSAVRGRAMQNACAETSGGMAAVLAGRDEVAKEDRGDSVVVANHNSSRQTVISGPKDALVRVLEDLKQDGLNSKLLPVAGAFHSPLMQEAQKPLMEAIAPRSFTLPEARFFPMLRRGLILKIPEAIREQLGGHLLASVEFVTEIKAMYEAGARVFLEIGPRNILTSFVAEILKDRNDSIALALDPQRGALRGFLNTSDDCMSRMPVWISSLSLPEGRTRHSLPHISPLEARAAGGSSVEAESAGPTNRRAGPVEVPCSPTRVLPKKQGPLSLQLPANHILKLYECERSGTRTAEAACRHEPALSIWPCRPTQLIRKPCANF